MNKVLDIVNLMTIKDFMVATSTIDNNTDFPVTDWHNFIFVLFFGKQLLSRVINI